MALLGRPLEHINGWQKARIYAGERRAISHETDQSIGAPACTPPSSDCSEARPHFIDEKLRLLIGRKVAAPVEFVPVKQV